MLLLTEATVHMLDIDPEVQRAFYNGSHERLTWQECQVLWMLYCKAGDEVPMTRIVEQIYRDKYPILPTERSIRTSVYRVRLKLNRLTGGTWVIETTQTNGYRLEPPD